MSVIQSSQHAELYATLVERITALAESLAEERWLYFRIPAGAAEARQMLIREIAPMLRDVRQVHPIRGWWWLCKRDIRGPAIRLRVFVAQEHSQRVADAVRARLAELGRTCTMPCYEPELLLFGGSHGMQAAHDFFSADSSFLASWAERADAARGALIPEALSLCLTMRLLRAAGLDLFECWAVFDGVAQKRHFVSGEDTRLRPYEDLAHRIVSTGHDNVLQLYLDSGSGGGDALLAEHVRFLDTFGQTLSTLYFDGLLECGLREFFVPLILFHWNRLLLSPLAHVGLSHAVAHEYWRVVRQGPPVTNAEE